MRAEPISMPQLLKYYAKEHPQNLYAADAAGNELSYGMAWDKVGNAAAELEKLGVKKGDCVMVQCNQDTAFLILDFALGLLGAVFVPIENGASEDRISMIREETDSKWYLSKENGLIDRLFHAPDNRAEYPLPDGDGLAEILYTTGTTGASKGIAISHKANVALAENIYYGVHMRPENVELIPLPLSHSHALRCCYANLFGGGAVILVDGVMRIKTVFDLMDRYRVNAMDLSPSATAILRRLSKGRLAEYGKQLDYIQIGTAVLPEDLKKSLIEEMPGVHFYNFYGSTESGRTCVLDFGIEKDRRNCIGKPARNAEILFTDENRVPIDATAEHPGLLASRGAMNMEGYWKNPELSAEIMRDGFVFTNDLGYMDDEGFVYVLGRADDVINYNGIKVSPDEVEEAALRIEGILEAACVPERDEISGQIPKLFLVAENPSLYDEKQFLGALSRFLDSSKMPKRTELLEKLPRTSNGKLLRRELIGR